MKYKHLIFTRFNLQYELDSDLHLQAAWLDERFRLFEQYCLPSIVGQTDLHFTWVILSSNQTPDWYKKGENYFKAVNKNTADNFTMTVMGTIDGVRCDDAFEIGVFCGEECRLSQPFYSTSPVFEYFGYFSNDAI